MFIKPEELIDFCYETVLNRPADPAGKNYYLKQVESGWNFQSVIQSFLESTEFKERQKLSQQLDKNKEEFIKSLYRYLLKREPNNLELESLMKTNFNHQELLRIFVESEEYHQLNKSPLTSDPLYGVMIKSDEINAYLLYPAFDRVQLTEALNGKPFQLSDFLSCMNFLRTEGLLKTEKGCFFDLGANIGSTSIYALKGNYFDQAISIEASALNYQFLVFNTQINQLNDKLQALKYGLADFIGERELVCNPDNCGDFRIQPVADLNLKIDNLFNEDNYTTELAEFITLDELKRRGILNPEEIGFVWIDCQGSEGLIFKGGKEFFREVSVPLYVEFWPYGLARLAERESYFDFINNYSSAIWRLVEGKFEEINMNFLQEFYEKNRETGDYIDILVMP